MATWTDWNWLGDHLAIDFANTVRWDGAERVELLDSPARLSSWFDAEPAPLPLPQITRQLVEQIRTLRDAAVLLLTAAESRLELPADACRTINDEIIRIGVTRLLTGTAAGDVVRIPDGAATSDQLIGHLAASVVDLISREDLANLARCAAPGCGQFFHRSRPNQRWCSAGCGNRARVDRHRHRRQPTQ